MKGVLFYLSQQNATLEWLGFHWLDYINRFINPIKPEWLYNKLEQARYLYNFPQ